jgi:hypothetical protein
LQFLNFHFHFQEFYCFSFPNWDNFQTTFQWVHFELKLCFQFHLAIPFFKKIKSVIQQQWRN